MMKGDNKTGKEREREVVFLGIWQSEFDYQKNVCIDCLLSGEKFVLKLRGLYVWLIKTTYD